MAVNAWAELLDFNCGLYPGCQAVASMTLLREGSRGLQSGRVRTSRSGKRSQHKDWSKMKEMEEISSITNLRIAIIKSDVGVEDRSLMHVQFHQARARTPPVAIRRKLCGDVPQAPRSPAKLLKPSKTRASHKHKSWGKDLPSASRNNEYFCIWLDLHFCTLRFSKASSKDCDLGPMCCNPEFSVHWPRIKIRTPILKQTQNGA